MGIQCSIILTAYMAHDGEEMKAIEEYIVNSLEKKYGRDLPGYALKDTDIDAIGTRAWGPGDLQTECISMKDWGEEECQAFIAFLKTISWDTPESVQVYWQPAVYDNWILFRYEKLFP